MARGRRALGMLGAQALLQVGLAAACVDGVTPNCADPTVQCGPSLDSSFDRSESDAPRDTGLDVSDAPDSAVADADLDAGDEGP